MRRTRLALALALLLGALAMAAGCAAPTPEEVAAAQAGKAAARETLDSFVQAVRQKDAALLRPLLSPGLSLRAADLLVAGVEEATWLERYSGYAPDIDATLSQTGWRDWQEPTVSLTLSAAAAGGATEDEVTLARRDSKWLIVGCAMARPGPGERLDPPQDVRQQIEPKVHHMMTELMEGRVADILYEMPDTAAARERPLNVPWYLMLFESPYPGVAIAEDLEKARQFNILTWPNPQAPVPFFYESPGSIAVVFHLRYVWFAGDIYDEDTLHLRFIFDRGPEGWSLYTVRLSARGIPDS